MTRISYKYVVMDNDKKVLAKGLTVKEIVAKFDVSHHQVKNPHDCLSHQ